jgi:hypothetical protein
MNKIYSAAIVAAMLLTTTSLTAQTQEVVLTTSRTAGQTMSFNTNAGTIRVDWGDGTTQNFTSDGTTAINGTLKGSTVKIDGEQLTSIDCSDCDLTGIDITGASDLQRLYCAKNALSAITLTSNPMLAELDCSDNQISRLNFPTGSNLVYLDCSNNQITSLSLSGCTFLQTLICSNNQLASLALTYNKNLKALWCDNNKIARLSLSTNSKLETVMIGNNTMARLITTSMPNLGDFWCDDNQLDGLDLSASTAIGTISIMNNGISNITLPVLSSIYGFYAQGNNLGFNSMYSSQEAKNSLLGTQGTYTLPTSEINVNVILDLSSQNLDAGGKTLGTNYAWQTADGTELAKGSSADYQSGGGKFKFKKAFDEIYCVMTAPTYFPGYVVKSTALKVNDPTAISNTTRDTGLRYSTSGNGDLDMTSTQPQQVRIYTPNGQNVWSGTINTLGTRVHLTHGIYIVNGIKVIL